VRSRIRAEPDSGTGLSAPRSAPPPMAAGRRRATVPPVPSCAPPPRSPSPPPRPVRTGSARRAN